MDLHAGQIQGFFDIPTDNLYAAPILTRDILDKYSSKNLTVVSPDVGGVVRARAYATRVNAALAIIDKRREKAGVSEVMHIIGEVKGQDCILVDDIVDSAGTLCNAANALVDSGAKSVSAYISHGVLSGPAIKRIEESALNEVIITDSIRPTPKVEDCKKIRTISIAALFGEAIHRVAEETSVSSLFD